MTTYIRQPASLPAFLADGHEWQDDGLYADIKRGTGHRRKRRVATRSERTYGVSWLLGDVQMQEMDGWFERTLLVGSRTFIAKIRTEVGIQYWEAIWAEPYNAEPIGGPGAHLHWRVTGSIVTFGDPTDAPPETGELFAEYGMALEIEAEIAGAAALFAEYGLALERAVTLEAEYGLPLERSDPHYLLIGGAFRLLLDDSSNANNLQIED